MEEVLRRYHMVYHSVNNPVCHDSILYVRYMDNFERLHVSYTFYFVKSVIGEFYTIRKTKFRSNRPIVVADSGFSLDVGQLQK